MSFTEGSQAIKAEKHNVMMRVIEILYGLPYLLVVILLMVVMGPGLSTIIVALSVTGWIGMARIVRGQVLQIKNNKKVYFDIVHLLK